MKFINRKFLFIITPFFLLTIFTIDFFLYSILLEITITDLVLIKELLLIIYLLVVFLFVIKQYSKFKNLEIVDKLKMFFKWLVGIYLFLLFSNILFSFINITIRPLFQNLSITIGITIFLMPVSLILKDLIYYKRGTNTARNLKILGFLSVIAILNSLRTGKPIWFGDSDHLGAVIFSFVIFMVVILSFRNSWITYLSKNEKLKIFFIGLAVVAGFFVLMGIWVYGYVYKYSLIIGGISFLGTIFITTYSTIAVLNILLHLPTAGVVDRKIKEVASLQNLSRAISSILDFDKLLEIVIDSVSEVTESDTCWIELYENDEFRIASSIGLNNEQISLIYSNKHAISMQLHQSEQPVIQNLITDKDKLSKHFNELDIHSFISAPLLSKDGFIGLLYAVKKNKYGFDKEDLGMLIAFADQAVIAIENSNLIQKSIEKERLEQELLIARQVQQRLLPQDIPQIAGFDIAAISLPATEVGGDYFDFTQIKNGELGVFIGDVSGKGTSAAFYMAEVKGIVQSLSRVYDSPKKLLVEINNTLFGNMERKSFISLIAATLNPNQKTLTFSRAGHCPLIYLPTSDHAEFIQPEGLGLCLDSGEIFDKIIEEKTISIKDGDLFIFFTDGATEATNGKKEMFGEERFINQIIKQKDKSSAEIIDLTIKDIQKFVGPQAQHDDLTMIVIKSIPAL